LTLYLDSSAILQVYLQEPHANLVQATIARDPIAYTCEISYLETRAGFARAARDHRIDSSDLGVLKAAFDVDWGRYLYVPVDSDLVRDASDLADRHTRHALRAFDALQLAAATRVAAGTEPSVTLVCFDRRLWRSARDAGFDCLPRAQP
jgi:predicted nucleic acid-binding protein